MIQVTDEYLSLNRKIQLKELEILKVFQDICRRHNLRYFAVGGTCLGAVRHKGFIPWDDDIDVGMPYEDYVQFLEIAKTELPENYGLLTYMNCKHGGFNFCKLHDKNTAFLSPYQKPYHDIYTGMFIDIFPWHGSPKSRTTEKFLSILRDNVLKKLNRKIRCPLAWSKSFGKVSWFLLWPMRLFLPHYFFSVLQEKIMSKYPFGCSDRVTFPESNHRSKYGCNPAIFPYSFFDGTVELPFEDTTIAVPRDYKGYLAMDFGDDYMQLPPEEKRFSHHGENAIIDFERPCAYYMEHPEAWDKR